MGRRLTRPERVVDYRKLLQVVWNESKRHRTCDYKSARVVRELVHCTSVLLFDAATVTYDCYNKTIVELNVCTDRIA